VDNGGFLFYSALREFIPNQRPARRFTIPEEHAFAWVASFGTREQKELALWQNQTDLQHWQSGDALSKSNGG